MARKLLAGRERGNPATDQGGVGRLGAPPPVVGRIAAIGKKAVDKSLRGLLPFRARLNPGGRSACGGLRV